MSAIVDYAPCWPEKHTVVARDVSIERMAEMRAFLDSDQAIGGFYSEYRLRDDPWQPATLAYHFEDHRTAMDFKLRFG